jgi:hypothetical protein
VVSEELKAVFRCRFFVVGFLLRLCIFRLEKRSILFQIRFLYFAFVFV